MCAKSVVETEFVCEWLGICAVVSVTVFTPPVAFTAYVVPAPTTNLSRKSGVPAVPSHSVQPVGLETIEPDHKVIRPTGKAPGSADAIAAFVNAVVAN